MFVIVRRNAYLNRTITISPRRSPKAQTHPPPYRPNHSYPANSPLPGTRALRPRAREMEDVRALQVSWVQGFRGLGGFGGFRVPGHRPRGLAMMMMMTKRMLVLIRMTLDATMIRKLQWRRWWCECCWLWFGTHSGFPSSRKESWANDL